MSDLNYNINANVTGGEEVDALREDLEAIKETPSVNVEATGITETAEGLESISQTDAATKIGEVGSAAGTAAPSVIGLGGTFKELVAAIGVAQIAGAGIGFFLDKVKERLDFIAQTNAWDQEQVDAYTQAISDLGSGLDAITSKLTEAGEFTETFTTGLFRLGGGETIDAAGTLGHFGFTVNDVAAAIAAGGEGLDGFEQRLRDAGLSGDILRLTMAAVTNEANRYTEANAAAADTAAFFSESQASANNALQDLLDERDPMRSFQSEWALLMESMSDGSIDTTAAANALNTLSDGLGLTTEEVLKLAQARLDETAAGMRAFADAINSIDFQATELEGATTAMSEFTRQQFFNANQTQTQEEAFRRLRESAEGVALTFDVTTEAGAAQQDALEGIAAVLDTQLAQAYDNANGSQAAFTAAATDIADNTLARLKEELNLTDDQVAALADILGLLPEDIQTRYEMAGVAEAQLQLGLLQRAIEGLPDDIEQRVNLLILQGDYVGARDAIVTFYNENPVPAPVVAEPDTEVAATAFRDFAAEDRHAPVVADADTVQAASDLLDTALEPRTATIVAHAHTAGAAIDLDAVAEPRTADINAVLASYPTAAEIARQIGTVYVNVVGRWSTRIEGRRPI